MGTLTYTTIDGYPLHYANNAIDPLVMTIFREADRRDEPRFLDDRNPLIYSNVSPEEASGTEIAIEYVATAEAICQRLDIMGFTLRRCREEFEENRRRLLSECESEADEDDETASLLSNMDFDAYVEGFKQVFSQRLMPVPFDDHLRPCLSPIVRHILAEEDDWWPFGFLSKDIRCLIRIACSQASPDAKVCQDITDLIASGWIEDNATVCTDAVHQLTAGYPENAPIIVLTEGSTDSKILKATLELLYPHLIGYYSFLDFSETKSPGSAGHLVAIVKTLTGIGLNNRVVAILDNDAAAHDAAVSLKSVPRPKNIVVLHYPDIEMLRSYPNIDSSGTLSCDDVNKHAGSIEMYLGEDVLKCNGAFVPVRWKSLISQVNLKQGEIENKSTIHKRWKKKIHACIEDPAAMEMADWSGLRAVWSHIFTAFEHKNAC